jgi:uncharacterized membrane protein SpoIIM required for sporulation
MVIESIIKPIQIERRPIIGLIFGLVLTIICVLIAAIFFKTSASITAIMLVTIGSVPLLKAILDIEEKKELETNTLKNLILRNKKIFIIYAIFFLGVATGYFLLYILLPVNVTTDIFNSQINIFGRIDVEGLSIDKFDVSLFDSILRNNVGIILLCILLSFLYGAGAILVLTWNASILGTFLAGLGKIHMTALFIPHTILEFVAYFLAAVSGGLIAVVLEKHRFGTKAFNKIILDATLLLIFSLVVIITAAFVEVYVLTLL